jgi:phosphoglucomutase/phosphomannomutase-like protein
VTAGRVLPDPVGRQLEACEVGVLVPWRGPGSVAAAKERGEEQPFDLQGRHGPEREAGLLEDEDAVQPHLHSGHYYFADFWRADTGMLAALHVLAALGGGDRYVASGEINTAVADVPRTLERVEKRYAGRYGGISDWLDGLTVTMGKTWFSLRPSNTEPLLRLNVESTDTATMAGVRDEVLSLVRG